MGDFWGPATRAGMSVETGPSFGVTEAEILPAEEAVCAVALEIRDGLLSCELGFRDLAAPVGAVTDLVEPERAKGLLLGDGSREGKGEEGAVDGCVVAWEG